MDRNGNKLEGDSKDEGLRLSAQRQRRMDAEFNKCKKMLKRVEVIRRIIFP